MDSTCGAGQTGEPQSSERYEGDGDNVIDSCKWKKKQTFRKYMKHSACNITVSSNESCHYIKGIARDAFFKVISSLHVTLLTSSYSVTPIGKKKKKKKKKKKRPSFLLKEKIQDIYRNTEEHKQKNSLCLEEIFIKMNTILKKANRKK
ncbi:conserved Plasmodium protein, unknown function [Plasmodium ovale wallikeri]|uniref:Uncharacterized protein n=1 Tax=Plasmodium ovale wallikeri TaxID=864142 RepID=A0A1A8YHQ4_PLAOA|nr:conserved Plasmodium protein, unknown function [Plasmodium ovale wallikeri]